MIGLNSSRDQISPQLKLGNIRPRLLWQGSLQVNPSVLIGSLLVGISPYGRFRGNGHKLCIFYSRKPVNSKQAWPECHIINYLLTKLSRDVLGNIGPDRSEVRTKMTEGRYSPVRLELARLVSSLLYGTHTMLVLSLPAFENKKYTAYDHFRKRSLWRNPDQERTNQKARIYLAI